MSLEKEEPSRQESNTCRELDKKKKRSHNTSVGNKWKEKMEGKKGQDDAYDFKWNIFYCAADSDKT